jgi:hypothetical protein
MFAISQVGSKPIDCFIPLYDGHSCPFRGSQVRQARPTYQNKQTVPGRRLRLRGKTHGANRHWDF